MSKAHSLIKLISRNENIMYFHYTGSIFIRKQVKIKKKLQYILSIFTMSWGM